MFIALCMRLAFSSCSTAQQPTPRRTSLLRVAQVTINLRECVVEDFDAASQPSQKRSTQKLDNRGGSVSLLIRISHKVMAGELGAGRAAAACKGGT